MLLVAAGWYVFGGSEYERTEVDLPASVVEASAAHGLDRESKPDTPDVPTAGVRSEVIPESEVPNDSGEPVIVRTPLVGRVVLTEASGFQDLQPNGTIRLVLLEAGKTGGPVRSFPVVDGEFELDPFGFIAFTVSSLELMGDAVALAKRRARYEVEEEQVVIHAIVPQAVHLRVVSAATGEHLSGISIVQGVEFLSRDLLEPNRIASGRGVRTNLSSPVDLRPTTLNLKSRSAACWVHSPGYAWQAIRLDFVAAGEREVRLVRSGELTLQILGAMAGKSSALFLNTASAEFDKPVFATVVNSPSVLELSGLAPGAYIASVRPGRWYDDRPNLARLPVDIVGGERKYYELVLEEAKDAERGRLAGLVHLPVEWGIEEFDLQAEYYETDAVVGEESHSLTHSELSPVSTGRPTWSFDFGELQLGEYALTLNSGVDQPSLEYGVIVVVEPGGTLNARLEVPLPARVFVEFVDPSSPRLRNRILFTGHRSQRVEGTA